MHLLAAETKRIDDGEGAVELGQSPGEIVFLSMADTELAGLAAAVRSLPAGAPPIRLASLARLTHPLSVDLYVERTLRHARLVVVRLIGGAGYWPHGLEALRALARSGGPRIIAVSGDNRWDEALEAYSTEPAETCRRLWRYCAEGGPANLRGALSLAIHLLGRGPAPDQPTVFPKVGYLAGSEPSAAVDRPVVPIVFYRALVQSGDTAPIAALATALAERGLSPLPIFVTSLKDADVEAFLEDAFSRTSPALIVNATGFAVSRLDGDRRPTVLDRPGRPVLQVSLSGSSREAWSESTRGLSAKDLLMSVVLPEIDGRLFTRAVSFKEEGEPDPLTDSRVVRYVPKPDRIAFVAEQAARWIRLGTKRPGERRIAIVLSNYPNRDGRIANGVGLDTPESAVRLGAAMHDAGYDVADFPASAADLMATLLAGPTNDLSIRSPSPRRRPGPTLSLATYREFLSRLPIGAQQALRARWGEPEDDPHVADGAFRLAVHRFGNVVVGIQPARGYNIDPKATYHDPDLVPPHHYLAFQVWLRESFDADAIVHLGKHGNLEWLPGKAAGLSDECWPEIALGPLPLVYPFIVNDPGEGAQAKRRASAVIVDHLMPAMTRAETYGPLAELETLIDEYALAAGVDARRRVHLQKEIVARASSAGLDRDLGIDLGEDRDGEALRKLDAHLCEIKEMQIRDGLHVLGASPEGRARVDTLVAIARVPRAGARAGDASLLRALAGDLGLGFDPLDCDLGGEWDGPRPRVLAERADAPWRTCGDTVERLELLATDLVDKGSTRTDRGPRSAAVLDWIANDLASTLDASGGAETASVLAALDGRFVPPGPSGAPTRGRPEVLPTGRNFYSVDIRGVPTEAAWAIGRASADALALRYFQDEGEWPRSIAISTWGTSNMRTGGDDVAQVLALIGAKPVWEPGTGRVTGFAVLSLADLGRPRIDVTLRVSGMFRDAFPQQIDLIDSAVRAVAELHEPEDANPIAARIRGEGQRLVALGIDPQLARHRAAMSIFGSKPGAYGAGMQTLIDEGVWSKRADFAEAYLAWGGFAYGSGAEGTPAAEQLADRLRGADAVVQNQDNREHDILDSDDYYQFQGGLAATVETLKGASPRVYHGDTARPEKPVVRSLSEEIARVVRGRAANPKWIAGVMRHGYKGAFEMAATVDYLFAYAATTDAVSDHHFDQLYAAYIADAAVASFLADANAPALAEMAARFREAIDRGLWRPASNTAYDRLTSLIGGDTLPGKEAAE